MKINNGLNIMIQRYVRLKIFQIVQIQYMPYFILKKNIIMKSFLKYRYNNIYICKY